MFARTLSTALLLACVAGASAEEPQPVRISVNGIELHYIEQGQGEPLILLNGGLGDYASWSPQMAPFSERFHVISYSRRHSYPNHNPVILPDESVLVDAADLAALIRKLKLGRVHLVGASYGAYTALAFACKHPEMVRTLVLAEPPVHEWARDLPDGEIAYQDFLAAVWNPAKAAFKKGDTRLGMSVFVDGLLGSGTFDRLTPERSALLMRNAPAMEALLLSSDPFAKLSKSEAMKLRVPALIVTGENTIRIHQLVDQEVARVLPLAQTVTIPNAGHSSPRDNPRAFNEAVLKFLAAGN